ncbi:MAG: glycosyltransferase family 39 protein, partial [Acidobacteriota bacterium]|nr:glycosyltransferase family 39 protein [Acidobacteriota bacterium]
STIVEETSNDVHPPLYYFALHYWMKLFGDSESGVRLLSALFGTLAIVVIYFLAALLYDNGTGLLASLLLALSPFNIAFSQEARMYTLFTLLALLSVYFFIKVLEEGRPTALAGYVIASALMLYTHVYSLFVIVAENLFWLSLFFTSRETFKRTWRLWLLKKTLLLLLFLPWLSILLRQVAHVQEGFWILKPTAQVILDTFVTYAGSTRLAWILFPLAALAIFLGLRDQSENVDDEGASHEAGAQALSTRPKIHLLLLWLLCPLVLSFTISQFSTPIFQTKYTIPSSLAFIILAARGLLRARFHQLRMLLVLLLVCFSVADLRNYYGAVKKDMWRESVARFQQLARPGDLVLFNDRSGQTPFDYYLKRADLLEKGFPKYDSDLRADNLAELLRPVVEGHERVWLVISHPGAISPLIAEQLRRWYTTAAQIDYPGVEIYLFEKK